MDVVASVGNRDIAMVYVVDFDGKLAECVEAVQPPIAREEKWVLMISTLYGCPVGCQFCDAGGHYQGPVSRDDMLSQIQHLISARYPSGRVPSKQMKIQFARMGDPAFNDQVLDLLEELPGLIEAPGLMPSLSTIGPHGRDKFFDRLIDVKSTYYPQGQFQLQFSLHTTDAGLRDDLVPVKKWDFGRIAEFGQSYFQAGDRKITLNFALAETSPLEAHILERYFDPEKFLVKITPLNPTYRAQAAGLNSLVDGMSSGRHQHVVDSLRNTGFDVIVSVGELEENQIGSNCGQYVQQHLQASGQLVGGYSYPVSSSNQPGHPM